MRISDWSSDVCSSDLGEELIVTAVDNDGGAVEVARHRRGQPGSPVLDNDHYPPRPDRDAADRVPKPRTAAELAFLQLGQGANSWLVEAAAAGARRIRAKMAEAVDLSKLQSPDAVDRALGPAAMNGRFADRGLIPIPAYTVNHTPATHDRPNEKNKL